VNRSVSDSLLLFGLVVVEVWAIVYLPETLWQALAITLVATVTNVLFGLKRILDALVAVDPEVSEP
jgi:uncharacterized protein (DUF983 family)